MKVSKIYPSITFSADDSILHHFSPFTHFLILALTPSSHLQEKLTFGPRNSYTVEGLKANTEYSFSLAAISNKGIGAFTNELVQRTSQASKS